MIKTLGIWMCGGLVLLAGVGCQSTQLGTHADLMPDDVLTDPAMAKRDWPMTVATYSNGSVVADPNFVAYEPRHDLEPWQYYFADAGSFLANLIRAPFLAFQHGFDSDVTYLGYQMQPSYYAVPNLPPKLETAEAAEVPEAPEISDDPAPSDITPAPTTMPAE